MLFLGIGYAAGCCCCSYSCNRLVPQFAHLMYSDTCLHLFLIVFWYFVISIYFSFLLVGGTEVGFWDFFPQHTKFFFGWMNVMKFQFGYTICIIYFVYGLWFWGIYVLWSENGSVNWPRSLTERNRFEFNTHLMLKIFQLYTCMSIRNKKNCVNMGHKLHEEALGRLNVVYTC